MEDILTPGRFYTETVVFVRNPYLFSYKGKIPRNIFGIPDAYIWMKSGMSLKKKKKTVTSWVHFSLLELVNGSMKIDLLLNLRRIYLYSQFLSMLAFPAKMVSDIGPFKFLWLKIRRVGRR